MVTGMHGFNVPLVLLKGVRFGLMTESPSSGVRALIIYDRLIMMNGVGVGVEEQQQQEQEKRAVSVSTSPMAAVASIRHRIQQYSKPMMLDKDYDQEGVNKSSQGVGGALQPAAFWNRVQSFHSSPQTISDWMMGKMDARLSPLHLSRLGFQLLPLDASQPRQLMLECHLCHRRKLWRVPEVTGALSERRMEMERSYSLQFIQSLPHSHHEHCIFRSVACGIEVYRIPGVSDREEHERQLRLRFDSLLSSLPTSTLPHLADSISSSKYMNEYPEVAKALGSLVRPGVQLPASLSSFSLSSSSSSSSLSSPSISESGSREAILFVLALFGWSSPVGDLDQQHRQQISSGSPPSPQHSSFPRPVLSPTKRSTSSSSLISCRWCRRLVDVSLYCSPASPVSQDESSRRKLRKIDEGTSIDSGSHEDIVVLDPVSQHRWYCPWISIPPRHGSEDSQEHPGFVLSCQAMGLGFNSNPHDNDGAVKDTVASQTSASTRFTKSVHSSALLK